MRWLVRVVATLLTGVMLVGLGVMPAAAGELDGGTVDAAGYPGGDADAGYLALGDSVAFGYNPLLDFRDARNFVGYPELVAAWFDLRLVNAACPGETSSSFVSLTGPDNGCRAYRAAFPLHVEYTTAQLDFAVAFVRAHPRTRLVTLDIGANDLFLLQDRCGTDAACVAGGLPGLLGTLSANLETIYGRLRGEAHYQHQLVALTYYVPNYRDGSNVAVVQHANAVITQATLAAGGQVADGFDAFGNATRGTGGDACAAGLLIVTNAHPRTCNVHPSLRGQALLARAIARAFVRGGGGE